VAGSITAPVECPARALSGPLRLGTPSRHIQGGRRIRTGRLTLDWAASYTPAQQVWAGAARSAHDSWAGFGQCADVRGSPPAQPNGRSWLHEFSFKEGSVGHDAGERLMRVIVVTHIM